jgi:hypothetical protein
VTCVQINEIDSGLSAPSADFNSSIVTGAQIEIFVDETAPTKLIADANEPCDLVVQPDFDHIQLVKSNEVLARILHDNSLFSITMDLPISLSHARDRISKIICLRSFKSVYAPNFQFHLYTRMMFMNIGAKKAKEDSESVITPIRSEFLLIKVK